MDKKIRLGISRCLLGDKVRFDGSHKLDRYLVDTLGAYVEYVPVCPEVECGLSVPRETMRLVGNPGAPRLVTSKTNRDQTERMLNWAGTRLQALEKEGLCGFIFKSKSPSSGMERVKLYDRNGVPSNRGVGIFAGEFMKHYPFLPVEEDGRLHDARIKENFIERIFVFQKWREMASHGKSRGRLVDFHTRHKLLFLSHSPKHASEMGKRVARVKEITEREALEQYLNLMTSCLKLKATTKKHTNVLQHIMGYFKKQLTPDEKKELLETIGRYHDEHLPLIVPITLLNHYVRKYDQPYLKGQHYLNPHPAELKLRNHV